MKSLRRKAVAKANGIRYTKWKGTCVFNYGRGGTHWNSRLSDSEFMGRISHYSRLLKARKERNNAC